MAPSSQELEPPANPERFTHSDVLDGLIAGLKEGELYSEPLELIAALHIALDEPDLVDSR